MTYLELLSLCRSFSSITQQAVTELIISDNTIPYIVPVDEIGTICYMLLVPNSYSVTAC